MIAMDQPNEDRSIIGWVWRSNTWSRESPWYIVIVTPVVIALVFWLHSVMPIEGTKERDIAPFLAIPLAILCAAFLRCLNARKKG